MSSITNVFFDLDHTLWDFDRNSALTFAYIFQKNGVSADTSDFIDVYAPINRAFWKLYREDKVTKAELRYGRLKQTFDTLNVDVSDDLIHLLSEDYLTHLLDFNHLFEGATEVLDYLKPKYRLHVITNGFREVQQEKLQRSGIDRYFELVVNSETIGVKKPNPLIFQEALRLAAVRPDRSMMIGDNLEADILGAEAVGMQTLHFNSASEEVPKHVRSIEQLFEIKNFL